MLCSHIFSHLVDSSKNNSARAASLMLYAGCLLTFVMASVIPDEALKVFIFSALVSLAVIYKNWSFLKTHQKQLILPGMLLAFGLMQIIWVAVFKESGSAFTSAYRAYQNGGKVLIFAALILTALNCPSSRELRATPAVHSVIIATALGLYCYAGWQMYHYGNMNIQFYRVPLGLERATMTAYALTLVALLASQSLLNLKYTRWVVFFYLSHFALSFAAIVGTQTRAAILVYPVLSIGLLILHYRHNRKLLAGAVVSFIVLGCLATIAFKPVLEKRYEAFERDMHAYSQNNSVTSIGARFAMQQAGFANGVSHPWGQSLEQRNELIKAQAKQDPSLRGSLPYLNVHLHNEFIDTFSLKGIVGVVLLLMLYLSLVHSALINRSALLLVTTAAIVLYGLSDVVLYSKSGALSAMIAICVAFMILPATSKRAAQ